MPHARPARSPQAAGKRNDVSDSYAKALVELAEEKGSLEQVHADVDAVAGLVKENVKLRELLFNPVVTGDKKTAVVNKIGKEAGFQKYTTNFLNLLVAKDRVNLLEEICESFEEQYCELTDTQVRRRSSGGRAAVVPEQRRRQLAANAAAPQHICGSVWQLSAARQQRAAARGGGSSSGRARRAPVKPWSNATICSTTAPTHAHAAHNPPPRSRLCAAP